MKTLVELNPSEGYSSYGSTPATPTPLSWKKRQSKRIRETAAYPRVTSADGFKDPNERKKVHVRSIQNRDGHSISPISTTAEKKVTVLCFWCCEHSRREGIETSYDNNKTKTKKGSQQSLVPQSLATKSELWDSGGTEKHFRSIKTHKSGGLNSDLVASRSKQKQTKKKARYPFLLLKPAESKHGWSLTVSRQQEQFKRAPDVRALLPTELKRFQEGH